MSDLNCVYISGNLVREPEMRQTPRGTAICDLLIASNRYVPAQAEGEDPQRQTTYVKVTLWNGRAEKWGDVLHKGDKILVSGRLVDDNYIPKDQENATRGRLRIDNVDNVMLIRKAAARNESPREDE